MIEFVLNHHSLEADSLERKWLAVGVKSAHNDSRRPLNVSNIVRDGKAPLSEADPSRSLQNQRIDERETPVVENRPFCSACIHNHDPNTFSNLWSRDPHPDMIVQSIPQILHDMAPLSTAVAGRYRDLTQHVVRNR
jgi:hypothetical protein